MDRRNFFRNCVVSIGVLFSASLFKKATDEYGFVLASEYSRAKIPYNTTVTAVFDAKGKVYGFIWKIKDIGKRDLSYQAKNDNEPFFCGVAIS